MTSQPLLLLLYIFSTATLRSSVYLCLPWTPCVITVYGGQPLSLAEKCALARSKSDFSARLPEQSDAVWTCKKSSHSIFVLIYNDIYHFLWSNKMVSKRDTHFTIDTTYCLRVSFTLSRRGERPTFSSSVSVSPKRASVLKYRLLQCSKSVFFSRRTTEHSSSAFELFLWTPT